MISLVLIVNLPFALSDTVKTALKAISINQTTFSSEISHFKIALDAFEYLLSICKEAGDWNSANLAGLDLFDL